MLVTRRQELWHNGVMMAAGLLLGSSLAILQRYYLYEFAFLLVIAIIPLLLSLIFIPRILRALRNRETLFKMAKRDSIRLRCWLHSGLVVVLVGMALLSFLVSEENDSPRGIFVALSIVCLLASGAIGYGIPRVLRTRDPG